MKKPRFPILTVLTIAFVFLTLGFFLGRNSGHQAVTVSVPSAAQTFPVEPTAPASTPPPAEETPAVSFPININTADKEDLMALPGIGENYAQRIITYREQNGPFSAVEALLNVPGIGEKRLEAILDLITIGG